jgi:hypothetical protein
MSRVLIIITPILLVGVVVLVLVMAAVEPGVAGGALMAVLAIGSFVAILVTGLVLMTKIRQAIRYRLPDFAH